MIWTGVIDLVSSERLPDPPETELAYASARILVRSGHRPQGFITVPLHDGVLDPEEVRGAIRDGGFRADEADAASAAPVLAGSPSISAVVCTRGRPRELERCLRALRAVEYPDCEFIIVDNAPVDASTRDAFDAGVGGDARFRYACEWAPGLSCARNHALGVARGEIIAFTDDDVQVDPHWLHGIAAGFERAPGVGCVTGLVASASLRTRAEQYFDARVWWSSSCTQRLYAPERGPEDPVIHPFSAGRFGTGANMAFRREVMLGLGGFDEALGAGSLTGGGEDLDAFARVLRAGHRLSYEPAALVWHEHRADDRALRDQMYTYGTGLGAYIAKYLTQRETRGAVLARAPRALAHLVTLSRRSNAATAHAGSPREVQIAELWGLIVGPLAFWRARRRSPAPRRIAVAPGPREVPRGPDPGA